LEKLGEAWGPSLSGSRNAAKGFWGTKSEGKESTGRKLTPEQPKPKSGVHYRRKEFKTVGGKPQPKRKDREKQNFVRRAKSV